MNKVQIHSLWYDSESLHGVRSKSKNNKTMALSSIECSQMHWDGDSLKENWHCFKQHVELMFSSLLKSRQEAEKCSCRPIWVGQKGRDICNMWTDITDKEQEKVANILWSLWSSRQSSEQILSTPDLNFTAMFRDGPKQRRSSSQIYTALPKTAISKIQMNDTWSNWVRH